ncbi:Tpr-related protein family member, putative [Theileria annulata]|uniref:Tpr-related protein family member, putative n=1 Tax=Theileria annulata TaxID=5874 RepID=Q4UCD3_THEAN|nr:Tpr-related protein family member, putative [Theileria annulata]CAI75518.1 Tpr-related protein family member, putative [Theileria annulata]|eukprot:XP_954994.1 Tpr-related protein family member, putative [Theileria annulata]
MVKPLLMVPSSVIVSPLVRVSLVLIGLPPLVRVALWRRPVRVSVSPVYHHQVYTPDFTNEGKCKAITPIYDKPCLVIKTSICHTNNLKNYEIQQKANSLSSTASTQSNIELASTQDTDLNKSGNTAQTGLQAKANELKEKAEALHGAAKELETAAGTTGSPLQPLNAPATALKNAAGNEGSGDGLYKKAQALAGVGQGAASAQANAVITAFEAVETQYNELMKQASTNGLTNSPEVIGVVKKFHEVKTTYYQMLIGYRFRYQVGDGSTDGMILNKASELHEKASTLAGAQGLKAQPNQDPQADPHQQLRELATELSNAVGENTGSPNSLQQALSQLKGATNDSLIVEKAQDVIQKYNEVTEKYGKVKEKDSDYKDLATGEYTQVKSAFEALEKKFDALKNSYENVLKLRVQELSQKAQELYIKANTLAGVVSELSSQANALRDAASKTGGTSDGLQQKATKLVEAINTEPGDPSGTNASAVITQFNTVRTAYNELAKLDKYSAVVDKIKKGETVSQPDEQKVKEVEDAYNNLKKVYDKILNVSKTTTLRVKAGASSSEGLRALASTLHSQANDLYTAVHTADSQANAAKVLKVKAGTDTQKTDSKYLRKLAADLYTKASELADAVGGSDNNAAKNLKDAVGSDEITATDKLRAKLKELASAQDTQLSKKAQDVRDKYDAVEPLFEAVKSKQSAYAGHQDKFEAVVKAWNAFNEVYKPEEKLATAVGAADQAGETGKPNTLREALHQLGTDPGTEPDNLSAMNKDVKTQYNTVKYKFDLVKNQESAYEAAQGNFKTEKYDPLVTAFNDFNNSYREAIYPTKFYSIIVPSIISMLSDYLRK